jgi:MYXO-CTERM domain-containing protein
MMRISGTIFHGVATWGGDISSFAGAMHDVRFACGPLQEFHSGRRVFDDVRFSTTPIPEPSGAAVMLLGVARLLLTRRRVS